MNFLSGVQALGFTRNETKVVLFLAAAFLAGIAVRWYVQSSTELPATMQYDYSQSDSVFLARSQKLAELARPSPASVPQRPSPAPKTLPAPGSININSAGKDLLMRLPGIGEEYAERIVLFREDHGPFDSIEQLVKVKGIGKKTLERIRPYITLE